LRLNQIVIFNLYMSKIAGKLVFTAVMLGSLPFLVVGAVFYIVVATLYSVLHEWLK